MFGRVGTDQPVGGKVCSPGVKLREGSVTFSWPPGQAPPGDAGAWVRQRLGRRTVRPHSIKDFLGSASALIAGERITRRDVIHYAANKLGPAHLDRRREDARLAVLDRIWTDASLADEKELDFLYLELASIEQFIAWSEDTSRFLSSARRHGRIEGSRRRFHPAA
jgi:hypothetical protein